MARPKSKFKNYDIVFKYVEDVISGKKAAGEEIKDACIRFRKDFQSDEWKFDPGTAELQINIIEQTFVHEKGEDMEGNPLPGSPFLLEPWQKFIIYNLQGFWRKDKPGIRRFVEAFIMLPRKNGKTPFSAALAWSLGVINRASASSIYIVGNALEQALQSFNFIKYNLGQMGYDIGYKGEKDGLRLLDNNQEHSIKLDFGDGTVYIKALASNPDRQDSLNCNFAIADEIHAYRNPKQYNIIREAMKAYRNKLMIGITTAGDNMNSFCYSHMKTCQKIVKGVNKKDDMFVFIAKADEPENGDVDYMNPIQHEKANPNYNVSVSSEELMSEAINAQQDPMKRNDFLAKSLNVYTSAQKAYFNIDEFRASDRSYNWTLEELAKLPIQWYGGADLSKMHDLTATSIVGEYKETLIIVSHAWFPVTRAEQKAREDNIPLYGWKDDGWLTLSNSPTVHYPDVVSWFIDMKKLGFKIKQIGYDIKFSKEFVLLMKKAGFRIVNEPQYAWNKSQGFRKIESSAKNKKLYYLHSEAYEYCVMNVKGMEGIDDLMTFDKVGQNTRIDIFDSSVFATTRLLQDKEKKAEMRSFLGG